MRFAAACAVACAASACTPAGEPTQVVFHLDDAAYWAQTAQAPLLPGSAHLVVTNNLEDRVSILDAAGVERGDLKVIASVPVGLVPAEREGPHHVTADAAGEFYYVGISNFVPAGGSGPHGAHGTGTADGRALKMRASDNTMEAQVRIDRSPGDIRLTPDGKLLLVSHFDLLKIREAVIAGDDALGVARLALIDPVRMERVAMVDLCPGAHGMAIAPDSSVAYVSCISDEIAVVDLVDEAHPVQRIAVLEQPGAAAAPRCSPYAVTLSPAGDSAWVSCLVSGEVLRFDTTTRTMDFTRAVQLGGGATFGTFTADGAVLIVPSQGTDALNFIDAASAIATTVPLPPTSCENVHAVRFTEDAQRLLVVCEGNHADPGTLLVVGAVSHEVEQVVTLGVYPDDIAILRRAP